MKSASEISSILQASFTDFPGADESEISRFLVECRNQLGVEPPYEYQEFLKQHNGIAGNGVFVYPTRSCKLPDSNIQNSSFIEVNLNWRDLEWMGGYLIFGDSDMDIYVLELSNNVFQVRDRQAFDNVFEEFSSFNLLLGHMVSRMVED